MHINNTTYRADIDGLRAVAVLLVLLFHFDLGVSGGFVGVDVFFVISGYLITEVIRNAIHAKRFSFSDFYIRRLLRLQPALIVTIGLCLGAGFLLMDPASFSGLATSAEYSILSASNFYFWLNQGYFDASAQTQPLLHTWSLATEWQFYLVWPFIVWAALKLSDRFLLILLSVMTVVSLAASQIMLDYDPSAAYFMMPFRVFELSIGGMLVFATKHRASPSVESATVIAGLLLIIGSAFLLDSTSPFPGLRALIPCLGAAACIYAGRAKAASILRTWPMVKIGLISYSVYLVHWPIIVFYKYVAFRDITVLERVSILAISLIVGWMMYSIIESTFKPGKDKSKYFAYASALALTAAIFGASWQVVSNSGLTYRINPEYLDAQSNPVEYRSKNFGGYGYPSDGLLGKQSGGDAYLLGDSFSMQYATGLDRGLRPEGIALKTLTTNGCLLSSHYTRLEGPKPRKDCIDRYNKTIDLIAGDSKPLIFAQHWTGYRDITSTESGEKVTFKSDSEFYASVVERIKNLRADTGDRPLIIIGSQPFLSSKKSTTECLLRPVYIDQPCSKMMMYKRESSEAFGVNSAIKDVISGLNNTYFYEPSGTLCPNGICGPSLNGKLIYSDYTHLSINGSDIAGREIASLLKSVIKQ